VPKDADELRKLQDEKELKQLQNAIANETYATDWRGKLLVTDTGKPRAVLFNCLVALLYAPEWKAVLAFNESSFDVVARLRPPWADQRNTPFIWSDEDDGRAAAWLQQQGIMAGKDLAGQAVQIVAHEHAFHPIREYLDLLHWDGTKRIDGWLTQYLNAFPSAYLRAVGPKWLIGAVARVYRPGCKNDTCPILEGPQDQKKSTAVRVLAGDRFFSDDISDIGSKDSVMQTRGVWIIELAELDSLSRADTAKVKSFMSRQVDRIRPPYGRRVIEAPRECVFIGTTNHDTYLKDETGARRFWPVKVGLIDIDSLRRDRDQLWAEARQRFEDGDKWWLDSTQHKQLAHEETTSRYEEDVWQEIIHQWIDAREDVSITEVLEHCLKITEKRLWSRAEQMRVGRCLRVLNFERFQQRVEGRREYRYRRINSNPGNRVVTT
jgi:predicted P-loop ATPase